MQNHYRLVFTIVALIILTGNGCNCAQKEKCECNEGECKCVALHHPDPMFDNAFGDMVSRKCQINCRGRGCCSVAGADSDVDFLAPKKGFTICDTCKAACEKCQESINDCKECKGTGKCDKCLAVKSACDACKNGMCDVCTKASGTNYFVLFHLFK